jgi:hypothetical protein
MSVDSPNDLYGLPLEEFVEQRKQLAKRLRADKQTEEAKRVAALKKPTVAAWAVNQLVRTQRRAVDALFKAGEGIAKAQTEGKAGAEKLREASSAMRGALAELMQAAEGLLTSDGHNLAAATLEKVSETLRAAALDPDAREELESGCLTKELQASGMLGLATAFAAPAEENESAGDKRAREQAEQAAEKDAQRALRELNAAEANRAEVADAAEEAHEAARQADRALRQADLALQEAREQAEKAAEQLQRARAAAE